ncbi:LOW QUALITY PROTEIN: forkhead box protein N1 [Xyrichtys novacula]|uniref:LOW QUALITY PROTEIN: forkhead box protein N1 n=1 Tax=Xyrichtys novacula TaxID=13765 RepID=A0AAV1FWJ3_XYRNO|nr:LOW QUALITY PROTEIN: forkhead box protein N1 [Xyrichtys novacula]
MAESQESNTFSLSTTAADRRHSTDGTTMSGSGSTLGRGPVGSDHYHPYRRQFNEGTVSTSDCLRQCSSSFSCLQDECRPDTGPHSSSDETATSWDQYNGSVQSSYTELPSVGPVDPPCFLSQSYPSYSSSGAVQQVSSRLHSNNDQSNGSKYSLQSFSSQSHQESPTQSLFPKPVYSYSILIFMALRNSKTGSLPVSEIYSFMTEHFPYFKTAPDGWKNSVRHNLSLNKCFVKVENKNGNSSRKGCLWALNPAKVEKMQEELHKWRRKDPITVRRSMAKPEDLDCLLGERPEKFRSLPPYTNTTLLSRGPPTYGIASISSSPAQLQPPCLPVPCSQYANIQPQQPCYLSPSTAHLSNSFALYSLCGQPAAAASLNSHVAPKMPPVYSAAPQADYTAGHRSMQEFLLEGDATYDVDTLDPSLTDLQLQGNLWEELQEESLVSDAKVTTTTPSLTSALREQHFQRSCLQITPPPVSETAVCQRKVGYEDGNPEGGRQTDQLSCFNGLHSGVCSGVESLAGYLTSSCTASISLM